VSIAQAQRVKQQRTTQTEESISSFPGATGEESSRDCTPISAIKIALLTGGIDKHYASGLSSSLASHGVAVDVICNTEMDTPEMRETPGLKALTLYAAPANFGSKLGKLLAVLWAYARIVHYAVISDAQIFHILWNYKFPYFDRTLLLAYFKLIGKRVIFTAHNVNAGERDGSDSWLNRISLRIQYRLVDHIFVHTEKMQSQIAEIFGARKDKISIVPFGTYEMVPQSSLTCSEAKRRLGLRESDRTILFFGRIVPYKGIDLLVDAFLRLASQNPDYRLVIAGQPMKEAEQHWQRVKEIIEKSSAQAQVLQHTRFIADDEIELYFKGADVLALSYTQIFQSGVLFMSYSFGLPVIATDVGSFGQDIVAGVTGYICRPNDSADLAKAIETYFGSELFRDLEIRRARIKDFIQARHSWKIAAGMTADVYARLSRDKEPQFNT
jgi:D-inositol-3-phosphate glycosyltransferase